MAPHRPPLRARRVVFASQSIDPKLLAYFWKHETTPAKPALQGQRCQGWVVSSCEKIKFPKKTLASFVSIRQSLLPPGSDDFTEVLQFYTPHSVPIPYPHPLKNENKYESCIAEPSVDKEIPATPPRSAETRADLQIGRET